MPETDEEIYLVWSNEARAWWGPNAHAYCHDLWQAGRYNRAEAEKACNMRTWSLGSRPPEVMVGAPEDGHPLFAVEEIRGIPRVMQERIEAATRVRMAEREPLDA